MKSTDKLRELCASVKSMNFVSVGCDAVLEIADEIEREIAERYMELPVDAEGVPIHYGDSLAYCGEYGGTVTGKVCNMEYRERSYGEADWLVNVAGWIFPSDAYHVKPRTVEDVLEEFASQQHGITTEENDALIAKYADELRSMVVGE